MSHIYDDDLITADMLTGTDEPQEIFECDFDDEPKEGINVLSLFDGMACGMLAFIQAGVAVKSYEAYEIDTACRKNVKKNFPIIKERGDVFKADFTKYKDIDYLVGGSPCTYWSIAQSSDKRETTAEGIGWELFSQYVRALREAKPKFFIYENNKSMANEIRESITETFGFEPICINSALVSAQNRQRLYWVGKRNEDGTYSKVDVPQPEDRGLVLRDVLEEIEQTVQSPCTPQGKTERVIKRVGGLYNQDTRWGIYSKEGIAPTLCAAMGMGGGQIPMVASEPIKCFDYPHKDGSQTNSKGYRVYSENGKAVTLCAEGGGMGAKSGLYAVSANGERKKVYEVKDGFISIRGKKYPIKLKDGYYIIRKLTVKECMRLQTVPEWYDFSSVSDSQAYKMLGNGWTVEVIKHLIESTLKT